MVSRWSPKPKFRVRVLVGMQKKIGPMSSTGARDLDCHSIKTRVRIPLGPLFIGKNIQGDKAQKDVRQVCNLKVVGSKPIISTK